MKFCNKCKKKKSFSEFGENKTTKDGYSCWCKMCRNAYDRQYCKDNPEKKAEWTNRWECNNRERVNEIHRNNNARNRDKISARDKRDRKANPRKHKARKALNHATEKGILIRPDRCTACKKKHGTIQGHHENYDKHLEVVWLCTLCHVARHKIMITEGIKA
jgi:hypothetical protein